LAFASGLTGSETLSPNGTTFNSTALLTDLAGYSNRTTDSSAPLVNSAFPSLDRNVGFRLDFRLSVLSETHSATNRAGFSVTLLDQSASPQGIELGFWTNSIFSQGGGNNPFQTPTARVDGLNTSVANTYSLRILDQTFVLLAGNSVLLTGSVQDYSQSAPDPRVPYNPYTKPNFVFFGDNSSRGSARVELGSISLGVALTGTSQSDSYNGTAESDGYNGLGGADALNGAAGDDWLAGGAGSDSLHGQAGDDFLTGGSEADQFLFSSGTPFNTSQLGVDTITDFNPAEDRLSLARSTFSALAAGPSLAPTAFAVVSTDAAAATNAATIVYNTSNGSLFYNPNGTTLGFAADSSAGGLFARLQAPSTGAPLPTLTSTAFLIG
jgi:Ca2+-binding RTX toxin-like protein